MCAEPDAGERAEGRHDQQAKQGGRSCCLPRRILVAEQPRQEESAREPERRDPEHREVDVPGPDRGEREPRDDVDSKGVEEAEEAGALDVIVGQQRPGERLEDEQRAGDRDVPRGGVLCRRGRDRLGRGHVDELGRRFGEVEAVVRLDPEAAAADEQHQTDRAPDHHLAGRPVAGSGHVRPVVRIGVLRPGTVGVGVE